MGTVVTDKKDGAPAFNTTLNDVAPQLVPLGVTVSGKKILIVDDNAVILKGMAAKLRQGGYEPLTAQDGGEAMNAVRRHRPDLILLDLNFPPDVGHGGGVAWDGFLIISWLRRMEEAQNIPIVVITIDDPATSKDKAFAAGAVGYLQKPVPPDELLATVQYFLEPNPAAA